MKAVFKMLSVGLSSLRKIKETLKNTWCNVLEACWNSHDDEPENQPPKPPIIIAVCFNLDLKRCRNQLPYMEFFKDEKVISSKLEFIE